MEESATLFVWSDDNLVKLIAKHLPPRDVFSLSATSKQNKKTFSGAFSRLLNDSWWRKGAVDFWQVFGKQVSKELLDFVLKEGEARFYVLDILIERTVYISDISYFDSLVRRGAVFVSGGRVKTSGAYGLYLCQHSFSENRETYEELQKRGIRVEKFCGSCC